MKICNESVVAIYYTLTNEAGEKLDASGDEPLVYLHGGGNLIKGLEEALEGKQAGESFQAVIEPALAYGEINPQWIQKVSRDLLSNIEDLQVGMELQSKTEDGQVHSLTVEEIDDETVTVNANHPLAGETLHFDILIESVRKATEEEIAHGHVH